MARRSTSGAYSITSRGIDTSSPTLGSAMSKAITLAGRAQRELRPEDDVQSIYIRRLGEELAARVDFDSVYIHTYRFAAR